MKLFQKIRESVAKVLGLVTKEEMEDLRRRDHIRRVRMTDLHKKVWCLYYKHRPYEPYEEDE